MSTPTAVADAELARILSDNEDYILSVTKSQAVDLSEEMFQRCVITDSMMDQFSSLDHSRVDQKLQLRYLFRLVTQRIQEDGSVGDKFLSLLESMNEYPLYEFLISMLGVTHPEVKRMCLDDSLTTNDISWLLEELAEVSPEWELLGIALGLPTYRIKNMKGDNNMKSLCKLLEDWLSGASTAQPTTLRTLTQALKSKSVGCSKLALKIEDKFRSLKEKIVTRSNIIGPSQLPLTITNQSCREVQVEDCMSTFLMVQVSHRENVSYQWNKNGQPLADDYMYSGVHDNILVISHAHQATGGEYTCRVSKGEKDVFSNKMTVKVLYPLEKKTLLDLYSVNTYPLDDEWPPVGTKTYINLVLIKSGLQKADTCSSSADRMTGKTRKIEYGGVFRECKCASLILVEGCPGSGKTTLVHKVIKDWAQGNALVQANLVFLISLRLLSNTSQEDTLYSILKQLYTNTIANLQCLISDLEKKNGEGVCFIIDGLDEYHPHMGDKSVIFRLLHKSYLPLAMIIVSSRPGAMARLRQAVVTQHIEVLGFTKREISEYIDNFPFHVFSDSNLEPAKLKNYLALHPSLFRMCYLPIHAAIICFVYQTSGGHLPHTQTKIYEEFTRSMILRHLKRKNDKMQLISLKELPDEVHETFSKLCLLAFNMTVDLKQVINERDISFPLCEDTSPRGDWSLGLVTCNRTAQLYGVSTSYMFLHLTLQEYLAAYHIANTEGEEKIRIIEQIKTKSNISFACKKAFESLWAFYFGLATFESTNSMECFYDLLKIDLKNSIKYAFESQQALVCKEIVRLFDGKIEFSHGTLPSDILALEFIVRNTPQLITKFTLSDTFLCVVQHTHDLSDFEKLSPNPKSSVISLISALHHSTKLQKLDLSSNNIGSDGAISLASTLCHLTKLEVLNLGNNCMSFEGVVSLSSALGYLIKLQELDLSNNSIGPDGAISLASTLHLLTGLKKLNLSGNGIDADSAIRVITALKDCQEIERVAINNDSHHTFSFVANVQLRGLVASDNYAIIDKLVAAVQLHKRELSVDLDFRIIHIPQS